MTIRRRLTAATLAATVLGAGLLAAPASAGIYAAGGRFGPYQTHTARCQYHLTNGTGWLETSAPAPSVWARNAHAGPNNDSARIRYRASLVNTATHRVISTSSWSGFARATDVTSAQWSGADVSFSADWRGSYRIALTIEWWKSTSRKGWVKDRLTRYNYYNQWNVGPSGPQGSCFLSQGV